MHVQNDMYANKSGRMYVRNICQLSNPEVAMPMMTSPILKSVDFTQTQKYRYRKNEILIFLPIKKFINYTSGATFWQKKSFVVEVTFKSIKQTKYKYKV